MIMPRQLVRVASWTLLSDLGAPLMNIVKTTRGAVMGMFQGELWLFHIQAAGI